MENMKDRDEEKENEIKCETWRIIALKKFLFEQGTFQV